MSEVHAVAALHRRAGHYDPELMRPLEYLVADIESKQGRLVPVDDLVPGMVLVKDLRTLTGGLLAPRGQEITASLIARIRNFASMPAGVTEPISVILPRAGH
jgi:hypothetical protein